MKTLAMATLVTAVCVGSVAEGQIVSSEESPPITLAAPADVFLSWTVSPGTFENGVWTIPGTTMLTASIVDEFGDPITEGSLFWQVCTAARTLQGLPAAECAQRGAAQWRSNVVLDPANPTPISPCLCAGQQIGFRLLYRGQGSGFRNATSEPFDLLAESDCPIRTNCP